MKGRGPAKKTGRTLTASGPVEVKPASTTWMVRGVGRWCEASRPVGLRRRRLIFHARRKHMSEAHAAHSNPAVATLRPPSALLGPARSPTCTGVAPGLHEPLCPPAANTDDTAKPPRSRRKNAATPSRPSPPRSRRRTWGAAAGETMPAVHMRIVMSGSGPRSPHVSPP